MTVGIADVAALLVLVRGLFTMRLIETTAVDEALVAAVLDFLERALTPDP